LGTIGGGALEWHAAAEARAQLGRAGMAARLARVPLGPARGQCCGGAVVLVTEVWDAARLAALDPAAVLHARPVAPDAPADPPLAVLRAQAQARGAGVAGPARLVQGWLVEPLARPARPVWVWGAGHVGRALVGVLAPLPDLALTWIDIAPERFPQAVPPGVVPRAAANPADLVAAAPPDAEHLIVTYSHALDLDLCHRLLRHGFARCGLIGSATKRARFASRLAALGHAPAAIARIDCPIGEPALGKHPQAIALGVGAALLRPSAAAGAQGREATG
jgi:xanthine dehydrogenase accessory factor